MTKQNDKQTLATGAIMDGRLRLVNESPGDLRRYKQERQAHMDKTVAEASAEGGE